MQVRFWGTRGSIAAPGPNTARYGGNTSCVEVRASDGTVIILDCGTGARELGLHLERTMQQPIRLHLFIGHTHWDHIQGFPFFVPAFLPGSELNIYAPIGFQRGLEDAMAGQMEYSYFPVKMRDLRSRIHFTELDEGFFRVGDVLVETQFLNHTAPTIAYRMTSDGASIAYATDHEPFWNASGRISQHPGDERHIAFLKGANLVIHDAQYTDEEYRDKVGWGHSSLEYAVDVALAAGVERLVLFHHDPAHDDAAMERMEAMARAHVGRRGQALEVLAAREGLELQVLGSSAAPDMAEASALKHRQIVGGRVLVVSANETDVAEIEEVLGDDGLVFLRQSDMSAALSRGRELLPDIAIIDRELLDGDGDAVLDVLRDRLGRRNFPIVVLADSSIPSDAVYRGEASSTDYLPKPFSPPMLRTRVRAWLARTLMVFDPTERVAPRGERTPGPTDSRARCASLLASVPLFRQLTDEQRDLLLASAAEQSFAPGHVLIRESDPPDRLFVILSGRVRVLEVAPDSPVELIVGELGEGEILGELSALRNQPRSATVVAVERTHCLVIPQSEFLKVLQGSAELAVSLLRMLAGRLYETDRRLSRYAPDPVTGLAGRRAFHDQYRRLAAVARRRKTGALLLVLDVFQLRTINDRFGYGAGDDVLRTVGDALVEATRTTDLIVRHGGDEFVVFFPDAGPGDVDTVIGRVREKIKALSGKRGIPVAVTCNFGVAYAQSPPESAEDLLREADQDMLRRKR
ncbi:MAG TPA: diguanylate cyclase [Candidatus Binatia bacterium]|nr:diguanylate cyclase [Candidatus Binatia bacterium]